MHIETTSHDVDPVRTYLSIFGSLMLLTALTVGVSFVDFGRHLPTGWMNVWNDLAAMVIALTKAVLVVTFFMHVRHATRLTKMVLAGSMMFFLFLFAFTLADYFSRGWLGPPGK